MSKPHLAVVPAAPEPDERRVALAQAIAKLAECQHAVEIIEEVRTRAREATFPFYGRIDAAEKAVNEATRRTADHIVASALGKGGDPPKSRREAEAELQALKSEHEQAKETADALDRKQVESAQAFKLASMKRDDAMQAVVVNSLELAALFASYHKAKEATLAFEQAFVGIGPHVNLDRLQPAVNEMPVSMIPMERWVSAIVGLRTDAATPLPMTET